MMRRRAHYVLSTHWDREWYRPQQHFRYALVHLLDAVLDALADGRLRGPFTCDGQAIMLEDYLEVRPARRAEVERRVREGLLVVGPWYTVPDEFLVSGEALVRNLRYGRAVARAFGGSPSSAGWVCDQFGHISQLPQIFAGFGIGGCFLWRGTNYQASRHFRWRGADGTSLPAYRFGRGGYSAFAFQVRHADEPDRTLHAAGVSADLRAFLEAEAAATAVPPLLVFDGGDHLAWDELVYREVLAYAHSPDERYALVHSSLDAYLAELLLHSDLIVDECRGELREPAVPPRAENEHWLIPGVLSSRVDLKLENAACESLLLRWAEPLSAWASAVACQADPGAFRELAWRWLLQNHAHDSLGGCSIDLVHADMRYRFSQCRQIAGLLADEAARAIALAAVGAPADDALRVVVFNPLPRPMDETAELSLAIPAEWPAFGEFFGYEPKPAFRVFNADGVELPYQRLAQQRGQTRTRLDPRKFPQGYAADVVRISLPLRIPPLGYTTLSVRPGAVDPLPPHLAPRPIALPTRHPGTGGLATSERSMANELLELTIEPNGTLTLIDRRSGARYERLLCFESSADIGDGWFHGPAVNDQVVSSSGSSALIALIHDGPLLTTFRVRVPMVVPARFDAARGTRSEDLVELVLDSRVSLRPGCNRVEVETTLCNSAADHRLRVLLPSGAAAGHYFADGAFDVLERPVALRADHHLARELEVEGKPQQSWTAVYDGRRGLAVIAPGLLETAVRDLPERPIALTLLRSTRRTVLTDGEPGGLLLGERLCFRAWIMPLAGPPERARLCELGHQLAAGLRAVTLQPATVPGAAKVLLPAESSFLALDGPAVLSSVLRADDGLELRLFNPNDVAVEAQLRVPDGYRQAWRVNLEGEPLEAPFAVHAPLTLALGPKQIVTLRLERGPREDSG